MLRLIITTAVLCLGAAASSYAEERPNRDAMLKSCRVQVSAYAHQMKDVAYQRPAVYGAAVRRCMENGGKFAG